MRRPGPRVPLAAPLVVTLVATLLAAALASAAAAQPTRPGMVVGMGSARDRLRDGRSLLDAAQFEGSRDRFAWVIANPAGLDAGELAAAHFGRGVSLQELLRAGAADSSAGSLDSALADYAAARRLDSATYFAAAGYNAALLERSRGRHAAAARLFAEVAEAEPPARRGRALVRAARELEALDTPDARDGAARLYRLALAADSTLPDARLALARHSAAASPAATLSALAALLRDSSQAAAVADAALAALTASPPVAPAVADSLLLLLTRANVVANVSIAHFALAQRAALDSVARQHPRLAGAVAALSEAYDPGRPAMARRPEPTGWWDRSPPERPERQRAWSGMMRTIGGWHERAGRDSLAAHFYGAALGFPGNTAPAWADLEALLPLVLIHDRRAAASADAARELEQLLDFVFNAKGQAYQGEELDRIRQFHMTLGAYYARRRTWEGTPRGAIFQLERLRATTRALRDAGRDVGDPPELLELLMEGYVATGRRDAALELLPALDAANAAAGRPDTSARWRARIGGRP